MICADYSRVFSFGENGSREILARMLQCEILANTREFRRERLSRGSRSHSREGSRENLCESRTLLLIATLPRISSRLSGFEV